MFFTIFIVAITFGTEPELHIRAVHLGSSANSAFVLGNTRTFTDIPLEFLSSVYLLRIQMHHISGSQEKYNKVKL